MHFLWGEEPIWYILPDKSSNICIGRQNSGIFLPIKPMLNSDGPY